mmetsp:Transcript_14430/g.31666  ORF Transcript_14430/g.31666 Transcript_14430/m.31666 type:complete len:281 (-) Transcript_14430:1528-2370(-)
MVKPHVPVLLEIVQKVVHHVIELLSFHGGAGKLAHSFSLRRMLQDTPPDPAMGVLLPSHRGGGRSSLCLNPRYEGLEFVRSHGSRGKFLRHGQVRKGVNLRVSSFHHVSGDSIPVATRILRHGTSGQLCLCLTPHCQEVVPPQSFHALENCGQGLLHGQLCARISILQYRRAVEGLRSTVLKDNIQGSPRRFPRAGSSGAVVLGSAGVRLPIFLQSGKEALPFYRIRVICDLPLPVHVHGRPLLPGRPVVAAQCLPLFLWIGDGGEGPRGHVQSLPQMFL